MNTRAQLNFLEKAKSLPRQSINVAAYRGEAHFLRILSLLLALSIAGYLYFVGLSIMNVIANREASVMSDRLQSDVASLEQEYFTLSKGVSPEAASNHGLARPAVTSFVRSQPNYAANVTQSGL